MQHSWVDGVLHFGQRPLSGRSKVHSGSLACQDGVGVPQDPSAGFAAGSVFFIERDVETPQCLSEQALREEPSNLKSKYVNPNGTDILLTMVKKDFCPPSQSYRSLDNYQLVSLFAPFTCVYMAHGICSRIPGSRATTLPHLNFPLISRY